METTRLKIKNMVCRHCIEAVLQVVKELKLEVKSIQLGEVELLEKSETIDFKRLKELLIEEGFELLEDKEAQLIERIKTEVIQLIHQAEDLIQVKNSVYLAEKIGIPYAQLSRTFSKHEHLTIERFIILQKIERVKELIMYDELTLSEISFQLGYSSLQHLSNQFKSVTGMSVSQFKKLDIKERKPLNEIGAN